MNQRLLSLRYILLLALTVGLVAVPVVAAFKHLAEGMKAPAFEGQDLVTGDKVRSADINENSLLVVVFWATWSPRSLKQLADIQELATEYYDQRIKYIGINVDSPKPTSEIRSRISSTVDSLGITFPILIDQGLEVFYEYGVIAVPSTAVIDDHGILRYGPSGYSLSTADRIVDSIRSFLGLEAVSEQLARPGYEPDHRSSRYYHLALNLKLQGIYERALESLVKAEEADSGFAAVKILRGEILIRLGRIEDAVESYTVACRQDSSSVVAWHGWGQALRLSGDIEGAKDKLLRAMEIESTYTPNLLDLGRCLMSQDSLDAAMERIAEALELNSRDPEAHYLMGQALRLAGKPEEALRAYQDGLKVLNSDN